jgi:two-component system, OmpR family, phosphate regulon sensor histidine kinase PhoR
VGIGKLLSAVVFLLTALFIAVLPLGARLGVWPDPAANLAITAVIGLSAAVVAAVAFWLLVGCVIEGDLDKLINNLEAGSRGELDAAHFVPRFYLQPLAKAVSRTMACMRQRIDQLSAQRRELEIQVRVTEAERQHAEAILHSISDAVLVTDSFNEVAIANESAAEALRFHLDHAPHQPVDKIIGDSALVKLIKDTRESANLANRRHVEHTIRDGSRPRTYDITLACVGTPQQEVAGVVTILHDITKEKEVSEMKSDFVSSVSHELRTPLSSIKAYVEMLLDGEAPDDQTRVEFYNIIQSEANRLSRLIDNILNISRIESGVVKIQREHISLPSVIKEVLDVIQPQARAKNIELAEQSTPLYYQVYADKDMIYQALLNLVGNAIKYTPDGGKVMIDTIVDDHQRMVTVNITDTGVGVPPDALPHLFEKFYRVNDHKKIAKGTGLGLNLVKHIVETVHGGKVAVESDVGRGSTFSFSLPISDGLM